MSEFELNTIPAFREEIYYREMTRIQAKETLTKLEIESYPWLEKSEREKTWGHYKELSSVKEEVLINNAADLADFLGRF